MIRAGHKKAPIRNGTGAHRLLMFGELEESLFAWRTTATPVKIRRCCINFFVMAGKRLTVQRCDTTTQSHEAAGGQNQAMMFYILL